MRCIVSVVCCLVMTMAMAGGSYAAGGKGSLYRDGEIIVKYKEVTTQAERDDVHRRHGARRIRQFKKFGMAQVGVEQGKSVEETVTEYSSDPAVEYAEPNYIVHATAIPTDPNFFSLWGMSKISAPAAWDTSTGSPNVVVAVIDTGIDYTHPDLKPNLWINQTEATGSAGVDNDGNGYVGDLYGINAITGSGNPMDDNGHGSHVSGTIGAAGNNGIGVAGVNWNVNIMACKFLDANGSGAVSDALTCLDYVRTMKDRGVNIVATSNSWGGPGYSQALHDVIQAQQDILFVVAAGNDGANNDGANNYPADYDLPNIISVAATDQNDAVASFSNYGSHSVHVGAPGVGILSTVPGGKYATMSGTSMATPHVSGLVALLKGAKPSLDIWGIKNLILSSGDPETALASKTITGRRINAFNALTCVDSRAFAVVKVPASITPGAPTTLSVLSIDCEKPLGPVTVTLSGGEVLELKDDGTAPDQQAGDGVFSLAWTPVRSTETLTFSSPAGNSTVSGISGTPATPPTNPATVSIVSTSLPSGQVLIPYRQSMSATGGTPPYSWSVTAGALPDGLTLDPASGVISGTPSVASVFPLTGKVTDAKGGSASAFFVLTVFDTWRIATTSLPGGLKGHSYSTTLATAGGPGPVFWYLDSGTLPPGLKLSRTTGVISGTPSKGGAWSFTLRAVDRFKENATANLTIVVDLPTPNLALGSVTGPATGYRGKTAKLAAAITNNGNGSATRFKLSFSLVPIDGGDALPLKTATIGSLAAGKSKSTTVAPKIPSTVPPGSYYIDVSLTDAPSKPTNEPAYAPRQARSEAPIIVVE